MASGGDAAPNRVEATLPKKAFWIVRRHVLKKDKPATWAKHASDFYERFVWV